MVIEVGKDWGTPGGLPLGASTVHSDAAASEIIGGALSGGQKVPVVGLLGGDLWRSLGGKPGGRPLDDPASMRFPIDVGVVRSVHGPRYFVAHAVAQGRSLLGGYFAIASNCGWLDDRYVGPSVHPNDGTVEITSGVLPLGDRRAARSRLKTGSHLPHPALRSARVSSEYLEFPVSRILYVDGVRIGALREMTIEVIPDAATVVV